MIYESENIFCLEQAGFFCFTAGLCTCSLPSSNTHRGPDFVLIGSEIWERRHGPLETAGRRASIPRSERHPRGAGTVFQITPALGNRIIPRNNQEEALNCSLKQDKSLIAMTE